MTQLIDTSRLNLEIIGRAAWVKCEDDFICERLPERGEPDYVALAVRLKRPVENVVGRVKFLRKRNKPKRQSTARKWTPELDAMLIKAQAEADGVGKRPQWAGLAEPMGFTAAAIKARVRQLRYYGYMPQ
jgi:hypothetical protein